MPARSLVCLCCLPLIAGLLIFSSPALADPHSEGLVSAAGMGTVDAGRVKNRVQGKLLARRAAIVDAQRNLLEVLEGVRVTSGTTVKDAQLESDMIANRVKGLLKGAFVMEDNVSAEGGDFFAEVTLGLCVNRTPAECNARPTLSQIIHAALPPTPPAEQFTADPEPGVEPATGLVIDTSATSLDRHFDVRLLSADRKEVYGPGQFDPSRGSDWLHWRTSLDNAMAETAIVGDSPLVVTASSITSDGHVILSDADARLIVRTNGVSGDFLRQGKVIIAGP